MAPHADNRLRALQKKHKRTPPHETMIDGGAMWRELMALAGHLDVDEAEERAEQDAWRAQQDAWAESTEPQVERAQAH